MYIFPSPGYCFVDDKRVYKLNKSLSGLKQASRQWFHKLVESLIECGYSQTKANNFMFTKDVNGEFAILVCYVDDIILSGNCLDEILRVKAFLDKKFIIED